MWRGESMQIPKTIITARLARAPKWIKLAFWPMSHHGFTPSQYFLSPSTWVLCLPSMECRTTHWPAYFTLYYSLVQLCIWCRLPLACKSCVLENNLYCFYM
uniref:Uncharacterized protein n=2 Tax=Physcomitrium patens TaxID=3218 RepID=A0A2K1JCC0_PHYPA|nr:hypothetical protein PHYPA_019436 [Physcomitrium patens]